MCYVYKTTSKEVRALLIRVAQENKLTCDNRIQDYPSLIQYPYFCFASNTKVWFSHTVSADWDELTLEEMILRLHKKREIIINMGCEQATVKIDGTVDIKRPNFAYAFSRELMDKVIAARSELLK